MENFAIFATATLLKNWGRYLSTTFLFAIWTFSPPPVATAQEVPGGFQDGSVNYFAGKGMLDCAPTSALQAFRYGGSEMQQIYSQLPGSTFDEKCTMAVKKWGKLPSVVIPGRSRFFEGMYHQDTTSFCNDILNQHGKTQICHHHTSRAVLEGEKECFDRIHILLKESIDKGFPVLASVSLLATDLDSFGTLRDWKVIESHTFTISKVPETLRKDQLGFAFEFFGPDEVIFDGYMTFEHLRKYPDSFQGKRWEYNYVSVFSRQLHLNQQKVAPQVRTLVLLTDLSGRFEDGLKNKNRPERIEQ